MPMRAARGRGGPTACLRLALALAALALCLFTAPVAQAARTEFFGIAQGPALDPQDRQGMQAARIQTDRFEVVAQRRRSTDATGFFMLELGIAEGCKEHLMGCTTIAGA